MSDQPNILLILADELRADALGCFGNPICRTPHLDSLAASGAQFEQCMITQPTCTPSRASILTGCYPSAIRSRMVGCVTPQDERFLPRVMKKSGYRTVSIGKIHLIPQGVEVEELGDALEHDGDLDYYGFEEVDLVNGHGMHCRGPQYTPWLKEQVPDLQQCYDAEKDISPGVNSPTGRLRTHTWELPPHTHSSVYIADRACERLERFASDATGDQPFFMHVSFPDPHHPNTVPQPYASMYDPNKMPAPIPPVNASDGATQRQLDVHHGKGLSQNTKSRDGVVGTPPDEYDRYTLADWQATKAIYYGMVSLLDEQIGRILQSLRETGLDRDTLVVFLSDHGDYLGDHGMFGKGFHYDSVLRTPLIIAGPDVVAGRKCDGMASTVDLAPTLLEYAKVSPPPAVQGVSMCNSLTGDAPLPRDAVLTENDDDIAVMRVRTLTTCQWKITWYCNSQDGELYDRQQDPDERINRWHDPQLSDVKSQLIQHLLEHVVCAVDMSNGRSQKPAPPIPHWLPSPISFSTQEAIA